MKRIFLPVIIATALCSADISAIDCFQTVRNGLVGIGKSIEEMNFPVIGKLFALRDRRGELERMSSANIGSVDGVIRIYAFSQ